LLTCLTITKPMSGKTKIAIFHNSFDNLGGAELVNLTLAEKLGADIYTTNINKDKITKAGFCTENIFSIGRVPINSPWKQEMIHWRFGRLNLKTKYALYLIAGDWALSAAINNKPNLWYAYSPAREIWDLADYTKHHLRKLGQKTIFDWWIGLRRRSDLQNIKQIPKIIAVSENVRQRIKNYFQRDSLVINPPVDIKKFFYRQNGPFWLSVNRLVAQKRIDLQLKAFRQMPQEKLIIVGNQENSKLFKQNFQRLMKIKPANVEILSWVSNQKLAALYADCRGFITTAKNEDFGLAAVEAMASGKPVIAPNEGGFQETIIDGQTGKLIDALDDANLIKGIRLIGRNPADYKTACLSQAAKFNLENFINKIKNALSCY